MTGVTGDRSVAWPVADSASDPGAITVNINGEAHPLSVDHRTYLLDALREYPGLTGTKAGVRSEGVRCLCRTGL
jgi:hypothetical protein